MDIVSQVSSINDNLLQRAFKVIALIGSICVTVVDLWRQCVTLNNTGLTWQQWPTGQDSNRGVAGSIPDQWTTAEVPLCKAPNPSLL